MEILWSPWRSKYIQSFKDESKKDCEECFFCVAAASPGKEKELLVVARRQSSLVMLNRYPYNNGHLMVAPNRHVDDLASLSQPELIEIISTVKDCVEILKQTSRPHGFNIGVNLGRVAGAGVPGHVHFHIVPRWNGDTSFIAVVADVKVVSFSLDQTQEQLSAAFDQYYGIK